jgi:hypothetical protein
MASFSWKALKVSVEGRGGPAQLKAKLLREHLWVVSTKVVCEIKKTTLGSRGVWYPISARTANENATSAPHDRVPFPVIRLFAYSVVTMTT